MVVPATILRPQPVDPTINRDLVGLAQPGGELQGQSALGGLVSDQLAGEGRIEGSGGDSVPPGVRLLKRTPEGSPFPGDALPSGRG